jgi:sortase A
MQRQANKILLQNKSHFIFLWLYRSFLIVGVILLAYYAFMRSSGWTFSSAELLKFDRLRAEANLPLSAKKTDQVDFSLWSEKRVRAFTESLHLKQDPALAVLTLERLRIRVPVFEGTDDLTLNRGAGWIKGTAKPGDEGNVAIAAHRDGFFRALKDVRVGDLLELEMRNKTTIYRVKKTEIINPDQIRVLMPTNESMVTLVTCFPFYYVGSAPQRFIVQASLQETKPIHTNQVSIGERPSRVLIHQE